MIDFIRIELSYTKKKKKDLFDKIEIRDGFQLHR